MSSQERYEVWANIWLPKIIKYDYLWSYLHIEEKYVIETFFKNLDVKELQVQKAQSL